MSEIFIATYSMCEEIFFLTGNIFRFKKRSEFASTLCHVVFIIYLRNINTHVHISFRINQNCDIFVLLFVYK